MQGLCRLLTVICFLWAVHDRRVSSRPLAAPTANPITITENNKIVEHADASSLHGEDSPAYILAREIVALTKVQASISRLEQARLGPKPRSASLTPVVPVIPSATVFEEMEMPGPDAPLLSPSERLQRYGRMVFIDRYPIYLDSSSPTRAQLQQALNDFRRFYYHYDRAGQTRPTDTVYVSDRFQQVHVFEVPQIRTDEIQHYLDEAKRYGEKYGPEVSALRFGLPFKRHQFNSEDFSGSEIYRTNESPSLESLRSTLESHGKLRIIDKAKDLVIMARVTTEGAVRMTGKFRASGEEILRL
ncbi:hypothetical protein BCV70DRAFT_223634 [Testicularia cyperi]|uniref:Uncharacterized protein n=1 Tax=Testicularia cyperi TaxID=1882483 RepID=A0A317XNR0_9BASI|nr:hypothetical protein BCV70DRAFT_223634 [Testicularia cyperi]